TLLTHQAWIMTDAVARTLFRLASGRGRMLEWVTAAHAASRLQTGLPGFFRNMSAAVITAFAVGLAVAMTKPDTLALAAPLLLVWVFSPVLAFLASRPRRPDAKAVLTVRERRFLRGASLKTWRFFRKFVGPEDNFLPPDNFQEDPLPVVAHRTSPTNMGLCLMAVSTARDLGWLGLAETVGRLEAVFGSMGKLERYRGHFYNWYGTRDLRPLEPKYISTVDSGNLSGHLLALKRACYEYMTAEILSPSMEDGIRDLIGLVKEATEDLPEDLRAEAFGRKHMLEALEALEIAILPVPADAGEWASRVSDWEARADAVVDVARALALEQNKDPFSELQALAELLRDSLAGMADDIRLFFPWIASGLTLEAMGDSDFPEIRGLLHGRISLNVLEARSLAAAAELRNPPVRPEGDAAPFLDREKAAALADGLDKAAMAVRDLLDRLGALADLADRLSLGMDFSFLMDP